LAADRGIPILEACMQAAQAGLSAATARKVQAFAEMVILGLVLAGMVNNLGFRAFAEGYFQ
jgi:hypothetical protein